MNKIVNVLKENLDKDILLLTHHNADPDSICSAIALSEGLEKLGAKARIGVVETASKLSQKVIDKYGIEIEKNPSLDVDLIILLDCSMPGQLSGMAEPFEKSNAIKVIIDHHPREKVKLNADYPHVDPDANASLVLVHELLRELNVEVTEKMAFVICFGLVAETAHLRHATPQTLKLIGNLLEEHDITYSDILNELSTPLDISERIARLKAAKRIKMHRIGKYLIAVSRIRSFEASSARAFRRLGADLAIVTAKRKKEVRMSMRADRDFVKETGIDLGKDLAPEMGRIVGGSGSGHPTAAGVNGPKVKKAREAVNRALNIVKDKTA